METYTIATAARLVGIAKRKLYQAVRTGQLQTTTGSDPAAAMTVTAAALQAAGFVVPSTARAAVPASAPAPAQMEVPAAANVSASSPETIPTAGLEPSPPPASLPPRPDPEQALIAHLQSALEAAQERERRLLDLLTQLTTRPQSAPPVSAIPQARPAAITPPPGSLRQQIVAVLQAHPEGLAPHAVRALLQIDRDVRSTMKGMVHSGLLTRLEAGRYVVAATGAPV
jgi:hypothetical protein